MVCRIKVPVPGLDLLTNEAKIQGQDCKLMYGKYNIINPSNVNRGSKKLKKYIKQLSKHVRKLYDIIVKNCESDSASLTKISILYTESKMKERGNDICEVSLKSETLEEERCFDNEYNSEKCRESNKASEKGMDSNVDDDENLDMFRIIIKSPFYHFERQNIQVWTLMKSHPHSINNIPWPKLQEERWRLPTFRYYPHNANQSAILLASNGFSYLGSGKDDSVICCFCTLSYKCWKSTDLIPVLHANLSPNCPMVTGVDCTNQPMSMAHSRNVTAFLEKIKNHHMQNNRPDLERDGSTARNQTQLTRGNLPQNISNTSQSNGSVGSAAVVNLPTNFPRSIPNQTRPLQTAQPLPSSAREANGGSNFRASPAASAHEVIYVDAPSTTITSNNTSLSVATPISITSSIHTSATSSVGFTSQLNANAVTNSTSTPVQPAVVPDNTPSSAPLGQPLNMSSNESRPSNASQQGSNASGENGQSGSSQQSVVVSGGHNESSNQSQLNSQGEADSENQQSSPSYQQLGIITERPKRFEYAVKQNRLRTFDGWPKDHHLKEEDLADAGFYFAGYGDCARCFYCGGGLRNWEDNDNVWVEHARWFPKCAYMRQTKGQAFVDAVQKLNQTKDEISFQDVMNEMGSSAATFNLATQDSPLQRDPAVFSIIDVGVPADAVYDAAKILKDDGVTLSADKVFEKLCAERKQKNQDFLFDAESLNKTTSIKQERESVDELKEQNSQLRQQTVCKICMDSEAAIVFLPCGHFVSCTECASALRACPVCRQNVRGIIRAFIS